MEQTIQNNKVIILNADCMFISLVPIKKAVRYILRDIAIPFCDDILMTIKSGNKIINIPKILKLKNFIRKIYQSKIKLTRRNIFIRDGWKCQYCSTTEHKMSLDHVKPISLGGKNTWENLVCACNSCNTKKRNRTPNEANMILNRQPFQPTIGEFINMKLKEMLDDETIKKYNLSPK